MACGRIPATLPLFSIWVPFQVSSEVSIIKERPHQRAEQYGHSWKDAEVRRRFFPLFLCQGGRPCNLSPIKLKEESKSRRLSMPNLQNRHRAMSWRGRVYYFRKESTDIESPIHRREQSLQVQANVLVLVVWFVMTKHFQQHYRTRKPLMPDTDDVSHWLSCIIHVQLLIFLITSSLSSITFTRKVSGNVTNWTLTCLIVTGEESQAGDPENWVGIYLIQALKQ